MASLYAYTTHRDPVLSIGAEFSIPNKPKDLSDDHQHVHGWATIDPRTGEAIPDDALKIGSQWFYPMHYSLNWHWKNLGYWFVGLAALVMLAALVTGIGRALHEDPPVPNVGQRDRVRLGRHFLSSVVSGRCACGIALETRGWGRPFCASQS